MGMPNPLSWFLVSGRAPPAPWNKNQRLTWGKKLIQENPFLQQFQKLLLRLLSLYYHRFELLLEKKIKQTKRGEY